MADGLAELQFDPAQLAALQKSLKGFESKLQAALSRNLGRAGEQTAAAMRAAVLAGPGSGRTGTRAAIAAGIKSKPAKGSHGWGFTVEASPSGLPAGHAAMAFLQNLSSWQHPVYGSRSARWVIQQGGPFFAPTIHNRQGDAEDAVRQSVADALQQLGLS